MTAPDQQNIRYPEDFRYLEGAPGNFQIPAIFPLKTCLLEGSLGGPFGIFTLSHIFSFSQCECTMPVEIFHRFSLPAESAVHHLTVQSPIYKQHGILLPRKDAESRYMEEKARGMFAALLTRESHDIFNLRINGIHPDTHFTSTTHFLHLGTLVPEGFLFRIPTTVPPRYYPETARSPGGENPQPLLLLRDPQYRFQFHITTEDNISATCSYSYHFLRTPTITKLYSDPVLPRRDCVIISQPMPYQKWPVVQVFTDDESGTRFLVILSPPEKPRRAQLLNIIFIVDHSESMRASKRISADVAVKKALEGLSVNDVFNVCIVHSKTSWLFERPLHATQNRISEAFKFLNGDESGGTELGKALEECRFQPKQAGQFSRQGLIITDGHVGDIDRILSLIDEGSRNEDRRRYSVLCIDEVPGAYLAHRIAEQGTGITHFLGSYPTEKEISAAIDELFSAWQAPVMGEFSLMVNRADAFVDLGSVERCPDGTCRINPGHLVSGRRTWIAGRCPHENVPLTFTSPFSPPVQKSINHIPHPATGPLWSARCIARLEEMKAASPSSEMVGVRERLLEKSLETGIVSSETAFFISGKEHHETNGELVVIPNALPLGWSDRFLSRYNS